MKKILLFLILFPSLIFAQAESKTAAKAKVNENILTGGRRTTAEGMRELLYTIIDSYQDSLKVIAPLSISSNSISISPNPTFSGTVTAPSITTTLITVNGTSILPTTINQGSNINVTGTYPSFTVSTASTPTFITVNSDTINSDFAAITKIRVGDVGLESGGIDIGGVTYQSSLKVSDIDGTNYAQTILHRHSTVLEPLIVGARTNNNTTAHSDVTNSMNLFTVYGAGYAGSNYKLFGSFSIRAASTGSISNTSSPGSILFNTTPNGSVTPTKSFEIKSDSIIASVPIHTDTITATKYNGIPYQFYMACTDETTAITATDTNSITIYAPFNFTVTSVFGMLGTAQTSGSTFTFDIKKNGTSIFGTLPTIDNNENTTLTAATAAVINTTSFAAGDRIVIYRSQVGTGGKSFKVAINYTR